jgi:hypothetical protein
LHNSLAVGGRTPLLSIQLPAADAGADSCVAKISIVVGYWRYFSPGLSCFIQSPFVRTRGIHYYPQFSTQRSEIAVFCNQMNLLSFFVFQAPPGALASHLLAELPEQVCRYYQLHKIAPCVPAPVQPGSAPADEPGFSAQFTANATI